MGANVVSTVSTTAGKSAVDSLAPDKYCYREQPAPSEARPIHEEAAGLRMRPRRYPARSSRSGFAAPARLESVSPLRASTPTGFAPVLLAVARFLAGGAVPRGDLGGNGPARVGADTPGTSRCSAMRRRWPVRGRESALPALPHRDARGGHRLRRLVRRLVRARGSAMRSEMS